MINLTSPLHTHWRPLDEDACPALPFYLPALWKLSKGVDTPYPNFTVQSYSNDYQLVAAEPLERHSVTPPLSATSKAKPAAKLKPGELVPDEDPVEFLRKRRAGPPPTVLILGDSVDRNGLVHFCQLMDQQVVISLYEDIKARPDPPVGDLTRGHGPRFRGWDQRGLPHLCEIALHGATGKNKVAMRVVNGFQYGMDALDEFDTPDHLDWHKPGRIETRIDELFVPLLDQMGGTDSVDLIILHSGMWDLVRHRLARSFARREALTGPFSVCAGSLWAPGRQDQVEPHRSAHARAARLVAGAHAPHNLPCPQDVPQVPHRLPQAPPDGRRRGRDAVHHQL